MAASKLMRPREPFAVDVDGVTQVFNPDRLLASSHPIVRGYPTLFVEAEPNEVDSPREDATVTR